MFIFLSPICNEIECIIHNLLKKISVICSLGKILVSELYPDLLKKSVCFPLCDEVPGNQQLFSLPTNFLPLSFSNPPPPLHQKCLSLLVPGQCFLSKLNSCHQKAILCFSPAPFLSIPFFLRKPRSTISLLLRILFEFKFFPWNSFEPCLIDLSALSRFMEDLLCAKHQDRCQGKGR